MDATIPRVQSPAMKWIACLALAIGCGRSEPAPATNSQPATDPRPAPATDPPPRPAVAAADTPAAAATSKEYASDVAKVCDVVTLAGADDASNQADRDFLVAQWLAKNLASPDSRQFLVRIQPLVGEEKASALEAEAARVGLTGCALAAEWRKPL